MGAFDDAVDELLPIETLRLILLLTREYYENFGAFPTAVQLRALMKRPS